MVTGPSAYIWDLIKGYKWRLTSYISKYLEVINQANMLLNKMLHSPTYLYVFEC